MEYTIGQPPGPDNPMPVADGGPSWSPSIGISGERFTSADASASAVAVTDAPVSGEKLVIDDILLSVDTAMTVDFTEETSGTVLATLYLAANSSPQVTLRNRIKLATADKKLMVQTSTAGNISITASYHSEL